MPNADVYARVSTKEQAESGSSLQSQIKACKELALARGFVVSEVWDEDYTGTTMDRPKLDHLRSRIKSKAIQAVICYATDRLARNPIHIAIVAEECDKHGVQLIFVTEPMDNSPEGQLIRYVRGFAAQIEREKIIERTQRGHKERLLKGKLCRGSSLFGYDYSVETGKRYINQEQASVIRLIYRLLIDDGLTIWKIANRLVDLGILSPGGTPRWSLGTVYRILNYVQYTGVAYGNQWQCVEATYRKTDKPKRIKNRLILRPENEWIPMPDTTPAIIDQATFDEGQRIQQEHAQTAARNVTYHYLLRGRLQCALCGRRMYGAEGRGKHYYYCCSKNLVGVTRCPVKQISAEATEALVWQAVKEALLKPERIFSELHRRQEQSIDTTPDELEAIDGNLKKIRKQEEKLISLYSTIDDEDQAQGIKNQLALLKKQRQGWESQRRILEGRTTERQSLEALEAQFGVYCAKARENIDGFGFADKREALAALQLKFFSGPEGVWGEGIIPEGIEIPSAWPPDERR